jgi:hypothetical protein
MSWSPPRASAVTHGLTAALMQTSYLTGAPKSQWVGTFDNYLVAWNIKTDTNLVTRVQWCQRGNPSNWTGEGSGFEDLLEMRGIGNRVIGTQDNRLVLFSTHEVWYGLPATYPAQFQFYPLDRTVGLLAPHTVQETDQGIIFLGSDLNLRILPRGAGASQIIVPSLREALQRIFVAPAAIGLNASFGVFDSIRRLYYLYVDTSLNDIDDAFVVNIDTGEWGKINHAFFPSNGCAMIAPSGSDTKSNTYFGNSNGTVASANSLVDKDYSGSIAVTASWDSPVIASDLPANWKQLVQVDLDYRSFSTGTYQMKVSTDGGNAFAHSFTSTQLPKAQQVGRATQQVYVGGAFPVVHVQSASTGIELHRVDVSMHLGGRRA